MRLKVPKTPLHEREFLYRWSEVLAVSGMSSYTLAKYRKLEPMELPVSKAFVQNWVKRTGFPNPMGKYKRKSNLPRLRLMYELRTKKRWPFKRIAKHFGLKMGTIYYMWWMNPYRKRRYRTKSGNMKRVYDRRYYLAKKKKEQNAS
tara:strand:+ start:1507 stop:1944 length:438 start_codon:yes stop_codon:yes gene_type:complete